MMDVSRVLFAYFQFNFRYYWSEQVLFTALSLFFSHIFSCCQQILAGQQSGLAFVLGKFPMNRSSGTQSHEKSMNSQTGIFSALYAKR